MKIAYIAGLSHSGSTLLNLMLSCHSRIVGIGESYQLSRPEPRRRFIERASHAPCSCGETVARCPVWSRYLPRLERMEGEDYVAHLAALLDVLRELYGDDVIVSDSSKYRRPLVDILDNLDRLGLRREDVRTIHVLKDVRNFALSQKRIHESGGWKAPWYFTQWQLANRKLARAVDERGAARLELGYEELCFYAEAMARRICEFLEIDYEDGLMRLETHTSHIGHGNLMRVDPEKSRRIFYDYRWFLDGSVNRAYALMPWIAAWNRRHVYGNTLDDLGARQFKPTAGESGSR